MINITNIYEDSKDVHVSAQLIYVDSTQAADARIAYKDAEFTEQFTSAELEDAFIKRCFIVEKAAVQGFDKYTHPVSFNKATREGSTYGMITYASGVVWSSADPA